MDAANQRLGPPVTLVPEASVQEHAATEDPGASQLQDTLDLYKDALEEAGHAEGAQSWLRSSLQTPKGTDQLYGLLQQYVQKPAFLQKLSAARAPAAKAEAPAASGCCSSVPSVSAAAGPSYHGEDVSQASFWELTPDANNHEVIEGLVEEEPLGSYILVEKEDVLDAIGTFVAAYLATVPQAQHMKPAELQQALTSTFRVELMSQEYGHIHSGLQQLANSFPLRFDPRISANTFAPRQICDSATHRSPYDPETLFAALMLEAKAPLSYATASACIQDLRKGHVRRFWEWGRCAYRCIAFSYGAFSVYENPWLVRAVVTALWTAGKVMLGMLI